MVTPSLRFGREGTQQRLPVVHVAAVASAMKTARGWPEAKPTKAKLPMSCIINLLSRISPKQSQMDYVAYPQRFTSKKWPFFAERVPNGPRRYENRWPKSGARGRIRAKGPMNPSELATDRSFVLTGMSQFFANELPQLRAFVLLEIMPNLQKNFVRGLPDQTTAETEGAETGNRRLETRPGLQASPSLCHFLVSGLYFRPGRPSEQSRNVF